MAAAVAKLCDVHELIYLAGKMPRAEPGANDARARRHVGFAIAAQSSDRRLARDHHAHLLGAVAGGGRRADWS